MLRYTKSLVAGALTCLALGTQAADKPNILVVWGDDVGQSNISAYTMGMMGYRTPNIDRIANEGMIFTDYYGEQSCTAGRSSFIMGQSVFRTGLSKVGLPGAELGMRVEDPTIAGLLKNHGYVTGQFGKNHLGDRDEHLPTNHGFDVFYGNLYHLNAEEEPENYVDQDIIEAAAAVAKRPRKQNWQPDETMCLALSYKDNLRKNDKREFF